MRHRLRPIQPYPHARPGVARGLLQRHAIRRRHPQAVAFQPQVHAYQHCHPRLQDVAGAVQHFAEECHLVAAAAVGQPYPGHAAAGAGRAFLAADHAAGHLDPRCARQPGGLHPVRGHHAQPLQQGAVAVQRMRRQVKADGIGLVAQPLHAGPVRGGRQAQGLRLGAAAEQAGLAGRSLLRLGLGAL